MRKSTTKTINTASIRCALVVACTLLLCINSNAIAQQNLPFYLPVSSEQFPAIAAQLEEQLAIAGLDNIEVITADYWHTYQQAIRNGRPGIYFAAPHFLAWSIHQHNFQPLLRIAEALTYVIASRRSNSNVFEINDLNQMTICTQRALNLDYLLVNTAFDNPMHSAKTRPVWSVINEMKTSQNRCAAFSISDHLFVEMELATPGKFIRLHQGEVLANFGFALHPSLIEKYASKIMELLQAEPVRSLLRPMYRQTANKANLVTASIEDYPIDYMAPLVTYWQRSPAGK
jgi:hypothetical protein